VYVTMGADSASGAAIMRADAIRFLRSDAAGADLEVGKRHRDAFDTTRMQELWLDSPLGTTTYRDIPVFNLGKADLVITEVKAIVSPNRWAVKLPNNGIFPLTVPPGQKRILQVGYRPFQEETTIDTLVIVSNDSLELNARIPLFGNGINYNFILNAHVAVEPHYNAPFDVITESRRPSIIKTGAFLNSTAASFPYPIAGGNLGSIVNTSLDPVAQVEYQFNMPDSVNGDPGSTGFYYVEWGILGGSTNGSNNAKVRIITPFSTDTIKTVLNMQNATTPPPLSSFRQIGGKSHLLNQGGTTKVIFNYTTWDDQSPAGGFLRLDLLRIRKVPTGASMAATPALGFGNVSIYPNQRIIDNNSHKDIEITSNGESALRIDSIVLSNPRYYSLSGLPTMPALLPAINGSQKFTVNFTPDTIATGLNASVRIYTNDTTQNPFTVTLTGAGIGTALTLEESNIASSFLYPSGPVTYPDLFNMNKWQTIASSGASGGSRLVGYIYHLDGDPSLSNKAGYVEYFPAIPTLPDQGPQLDTFAVYAKMTIGSTNASPRAKYTIFPAGGGAPAESVINQNNRGDLVFLGNHVFLRSNNRDAHGGAAINGYIRLENDTALVNAYYKDSLVNVAKRDTFVLRADAIILFETNIITGVGYEVMPTIPTEYALSQNYPNPFNPSTRIEFALPAAENVSLKIYDILGREVRSLINDQYNPGRYDITWDGKNNLGSQVSTGMYIYHLRAGQFSQTKKMMLMK
ncbi:MAG: choice-of-anchor D domain-containing protein, partial [Bacteroidetes bacterium]|nr:choice-of-anchor D domain-containing protein [Bacteroidota bacterium]